MWTSRLFLLGGCSCENMIVVTIRFKPAVLFFEDHHPCQKDSVNINIYTFARISSWSRIWKNQEYAWENVVLLRKSIFYLLQDDSKDQFVGECSMVTPGFSRKLATGRSAVWHEMCHTHAVHRKLHQGRGADDVDILMGQYYLISWMG